MRYELADAEWTAIKPMLLNKLRGVRGQQVHVALIIRRTP